MDVDQLKQLLQQYLLTPLNNLPVAQIKALDTNHDQSVQDFQNALNLLFGPGANPFQGQAADAIADYVSKYLDAEEALSPYVCGDLSDRVNTLLSKCAGILAQEEPLMKAVQSNGAWGVAGSFVMQQEQQEGSETPPTPGNPFWDLIQLFILIGGVVVLVWATADQANKVQDLTAYMDMWVNDMKALAQQPDPAGSQLPALPSQISQAITFDTQSIVLNEIEIAEELFTEFGGTVSMADIQDIIGKNPGLTKDQYRLLVEYYRRYHKKPFNVVGVVGVGTNKQGKPAKIFIITQGDIDHIKGGHDEFASLSDAQLAQLLMDLLQQQTPAWVEHFQSSDVYYYTDVEIDGKYYTIGISVSTTNAGRIVTAFQDYDS